MKKALLLVAALVAVFAISSCRSSRPACPAYVFASVAQF